MTRPKGAARQAVPRRGPTRSETATTRPLRRAPAVEVVPIYEPDLRREVSVLLLLLARAEVGDRALDGLGRERIDGGAPALLPQPGARRTTTEE